MSMTTAHDGAPRSPGRPREFDLDDALDKAIVAFTEHGYHATSLGKLTEAMEIAEGSIYKAFRDKRGVFLAAFERYVALRRERLERELAGATTGRDKVKAMLAVYAEYSQGVSGRRGCLLIGSAVDLASSDPEMATRVAATFANHETRLVGFIREGKKDGTVSSQVDPAITARLLLCVMQGMRVLGKTGGFGEELSDMVDSALKLLD